MERHRLAARQPDRAQFTDANLQGVTNGRPQTASLAAEDDATISIQHAGQRAESDAAQ